MKSNPFYVGLNSNQLIKNKFQMCKKLHIDELFSNFSCVLLLINRFIRFELSTDAMCNFLPMLPIFI